MWLNKWKRNNWKLGTGKDVKNREDLEKLDQAMNGIEIKWVRYDQNLMSCSSMFN